jgi:hypothetical protein
VLARNYLVFKVLGMVNTHNLVLRQKAKIWLNFCNNPATPRLIKLLRYVRFKATTTINQFHPKDTLMVISHSQSFL